MNLSSFGGFLTQFLFHGVNYYFSSKDVGTLESVVDLMEKAMLENAGDREARYIPYDISGVKKTAVGSIIEN